MKIVQIKYYDGAHDKVFRLGLSNIFLELLESLIEVKINLKEEKNANGAATIRKSIDASLEKRKGWVKTTTGDVDWKKESDIECVVFVRIGIEIQVSARSDLIIRDLVHLRKNIQDGEIEVGVIVIPSDKMQRFLPDRTPSYSDAIRYIEDEFQEARNSPLVIVVIEHDGQGEALPKQARLRESNNI